MNNSKIIV